MPIELFAAIVGGVLAIIAALIPIMMRKRQEKKERVSIPTYTATEGLSAVVGIVQKGKEVLMVQRRTRICDLSWQFPAGVVKPGTDLRDKIESEVMQETGVRCKVKRFLGARVHRDTKVLCHYVHCAYLGGEARNLDTEENAQVAWVHVEDVRRHTTSSIFIEVERLLDEIAGEDDPPRVALGIVTFEGNVLVVRRKRGNSVLDWHFPGGVVEEGESEDEAAAREVAEETGINCTPVRKMGERVHPDTGQMVAYWLCKYEDGQATLREPTKFSEVVWMSPEEVLDTFGDRLFEPARSYVQSEAISNDYNSGSPFEKEAWRSE